MNYVIYIPLIHVYLEILDVANHSITIKSEKSPAITFVYSIRMISLFRLTIPTKIFPAALMDSAGDVPSKKAKACPIFLTMNCITPR